MRLTKSVVDKIEPPKDKDQAFYRDDKLKGFAVRVTTTGVKSFVVEKLISRKVKRITLGRYGEITVEQARKEAQKLLGKIATGIDPIAEKRSAKASIVTLNEVFQDYLNARKSLKPKTLYDYKNTLRVAFADWKNRPLLSITKDKVIKHHEKLGLKHGAAYANQAMRILRALFNFAAGVYEDAVGRSLITENPVRRLSQARAWYRVERRQTFIKSHELAAWSQGVMNLQNETLQDYLMLILFTGLRRQEAAQLQWNQVDLKTKTLTILDTKNRQSHTLPLSDYLHKLLTRRRKQISVSVSDYVFSGSGKKGYIIEPRKQMAKVIEATGIQFTVHDLRRTFITIAESLDIPAYALKRLLNHKMAGDVTAGYIILDVERLRKPMQMIADFISRKMELNKTSNISSFGASENLVLTDKI
jgi:integrase